MRDAINEEVILAARLFLAIIGNSTIIAAFKSGIPGNGKPFPDGSKIAKVQWKPKKSTEAPFSADVPDTLEIFFQGERQQEISGDWRMGIRSV